MKTSTDNVVIIGGGPAGSALGCYVSEAGINNTIYEAANHPRPHVGESMVMSSVQVFEEIGFLPVLEREGFVKKHGLPGIRRCPRAKRPSLSMNSLSACRSRAHSSIEVSPLFRSSDR